MKTVRHTLVHLALAALFLRALLPAGWMPNPEAGAPFIICSVAEPVTSLDGKTHKPAQDDPRAHETCPFAAAAPLAAAPNAAILRAPRASRLAASQRPAFAEPVSPAAYAPQSPRAPPVLI